MTENLIALVADVSELRREIELATIRGLDEDAIDALRGVLIDRTLDVERVLVAAGLPPFTRHADRNA